ncbi:MAG: hypothetical protein PF503_16275 [Desulfobacula sp.]|jgi:hypothetical protein|nr:hypothetical protein [Desulfobacula sp.]
MKEIWPYLVPLFCIGIAISIYRVQKRRKKDYRELIEPNLNMYGYEFVSSITPKLFDVGPFPKFEITVGSTQTRTPIGSGEYTEYRIVRFINKNNSEEKESWVKLEFEAFMFKSVTWKPELN